ncbi:MAG TPA: hypothetical protein VLE97_07235 [Gaiellaceae bacterium]|nr:hypothetical protein [Gaiellaceae bacterium]
MTTLETKILRALAAYKVERGMSAQAATAWANANLQRGITKWKEARGKIPSQDRMYDGDAFNALKQWAQSA